MAWSNQITLVYKYCSVLLLLRSLRPQSSSLTCSMRHQQMRHQHGHWLCCMWIGGNTSFREEYTYKYYLRNYAAKFNPTLIPSRLPCARVSECFGMFGRNINRSKCVPKYKQFFVLIYIQRGLYISVHGGTWCDNYLTTTCCAVVCIVFD